MKARTAWIVAAVAVAVALVAMAAVFLRRTPPTEQQAVRFTVGPPEGGSFSGGLRNFPSISPDGSKLAFAAAAGASGPQLWIRSLDSPTTQLLPGTENGEDPFWSPDSRFVGFFADGKLKKIATSGGPVQVIAEGPGGSTATWSRYGVVLFRGLAGILYRVTESGGIATPVATPDGSRSEIFLESPRFLPDGTHFLYYAYSTAPENSGIYAASLDSKDRKLILKINSYISYAPPGYLLFQRQGTLMAQPFDADRLQLMGEAVPIVEGVDFNPFGGSTVFTVSDNGVLAYRGGGGAVPLTLVWVSRNGIEQTLAAPPHNYTFPRISPDGKRVAAGIEEGMGQIWLYDISRDALSRLTFEGSSNVDPVWTPDGKRITFKGKGNRLFWQPADGGGSAEELTTNKLDGNSIPSSWSPSGQELAFLDGGQIRKIWILPVKDRNPRVFAESLLYAAAPTFSPDGRWIAYVSNESGRNEVYVRPYPGPGGKWQISTEGGTEPAWNPKGRELFYRIGQKMMAVDYSAQPTFSAGKPRMLFQGPYTTTPRSATDYDVSPDGQRFLMLKAAAEQAPGQINVVLNWFEELKQNIPTGKK